jgi:hypothetical protein
VGLFGVDEEKIDRWRSEGKVSRLRAAVEEGGEPAEAAMRALASVVADPLPPERVPEARIVEAFEALLQLDQHEAVTALTAYVEHPSVRSAVAAEMFARLAATRSDAALVTLLRLAGSPVGTVGRSAVEAALAMSHPRFDAEFLRALLLAEGEALDNLVMALQSRRVAGSAELLVRHFRSVSGSSRWAVVRALVRQGFAPAESPDLELAAWLWVESERYGRAASLGPVSWAPLAQALGAWPVADERTQSVVAALARVDAPRLFEGLRMRLLRAVNDAAFHPRTEQYESADREAAWVLPALATLFARETEVRVVSEMIAARKFRAAASVLESL